MTIGITAAKPFPSGEEMAAVGGKTAVEGMATKPISRGTAAEQPTYEVIGEDSQEHTCGRYVGPMVTGQGRSLSMPRMEQMNSNQASSLLQKRAQAARGELRLPSFQSLGIGLPHPDHLLTPPDEADYFAIDPLALPHQAGPIPRSAPNLPTINMASNNQTTPPQESESTMPQESEDNQSNISTAASSQVTGSVAQNASSTDPVLERHHSSSSEEDTPRGPVWLEKVVDAVGMSCYLTGSQNHAMAVEETDL